MAKKKPANESDAETASIAFPPHPRFTATLHGHDAAAGQFMQAFRHNALHHAFFVTGLPGVGKATFAYHAARFLLVAGDGLAGGTATLNIPANHTVFRQVASGAHPGLFVLERGDEKEQAKPAATITVDDVRRLKSFLNLTVAEGWRVVIIDGAERLTGSSANALLKAVEEPPPRTVFFILSPISGILPTIRSRCARLLLRGLASGEVEKAVLAAFASAGMGLPAGPQLKQAVALSQGAPGKALSLLQEGGLDLLDRLGELFNAPHRLDYTRVHGLIDIALRGQDGQFSLLCTFVEERLEQAIRHLAANFAGGSQAHALARWAELWENMRKKRAETEVLNLDKPAFLLDTFATIEALARETVPHLPGLPAALAAPKQS